MAHHVLFVCTGNTCRSPLAEGMARRLAATVAIDATFVSAGTSALQGTPASDGSMLVGLERDIDLSSHRAQPLTRALVAQATLILGMAPHHVEQALALGGDGKTFLLATYADGGTAGPPIHDPFGEGLDAYRRMADELDVVLPKALQRLVQRSSD